MKYEQFQGKISDRSMLVECVMLFKEQLLEGVQTGPVSKGKGNNICELPVCQHSWIGFQWTQLFSSP